MMGLVLDPVVPVGAVALLGLVMLALTVAVYRRAGASLTAGQGAVLLGCRIAGVALVLLALLQPSRVERIPPRSAKQVTLIAVDDSQSMAQRDVAQGTRAEQARAILSEAGLIAPDGSPARPEVRLFRFSDDAAALASAASLEASGTTTRLHRSIATTLASLRTDESARALVLLSDGHDFELVNPAKTGLLARSRDTPILAVALGRLGKVRDVSTRITSYQPYTYVKQKARVAAALRLIGCELETLTVELWREGKVVQATKIAAGEEAEVPVSFEVVEPAIGQFAYEVRVKPLERETDRENNQALTYLNVIDQQIEVLFLEGAPYWDTTFLSRSLMRNDKMNVDSIVQYATGKARRIRKKGGKEELRIPASVAEWQRYDIVVLGRSIENLLGPEQLRQLEESVQDHGGTVIFARGPALGGPLAKNELEPVAWAAAASEHVRLEVSREGQALAPLRAIQPGADTMPELIGAHPARERKPLTATLASARPASGGEPTPGIVHRRLGSGQVLSVGVDGLWRWGFNPHVEGNNTAFDRFWDQMILWLLAGRDFSPTQAYALRGSGANIPLGEKIYFHAQKRDSAPFSADLTLRVEHAGKEVTRTTLSQPDDGAPGRLSAEFLPATTGRYSATTQFPDGTRQTVRFIVFDENLEKTEVATDAGLLKTLSEASGGRLLAPEEVGEALADLARPETAAAAVEKRTSVWDRWWVFWTIGLLLGTDWYLRRRWGLS
jgi:hypothetical protein